VCAWNPHGSQPRSAFQPQLSMPTFGSGFCLELCLDAARPRGFVNSVCSTWTPCLASCLALPMKRKCIMHGSCLRQSHDLVGILMANLPRHSLMQDEWGTRSAGAQGERPGRDQEGKHGLVFRPTQVPVQLHSQPAVGPWAGHRTSLCLHFLMCTWGHGEIKIMSDVPRSRCCMTNSSSP